MNAIFFPLHLSDFFFLDIGLRVVTHLIDFSLDCLPVRSQEIALPKPGLVVSELLSKSPNFFMKSASRLCVGGNEMGVKALQ
jgi:hypothetical protein